MPPRNFSRRESRKRHFRYSLLVFLFMFALSCLWTGFSLRGADRALLGAGYEGEKQAPAEAPGLSWVERELIWALPSPNPAAAARRFFLEAALPGRDEAGRLLVAAPVSAPASAPAAAGLPDMAAAGAAAGGGVSGKTPAPDSATALVPASAELEEDYTLYADPYAAGWPEYPMDDVVLIPQGEPRVLIYHTHNSEAYSGDKQGKGAGGVINAGRVLAQTLESDFGIKTAHSEAVNDRPDFTKSYINSQHLLQQFITKYPGMEIVIDLHRDAGMNKRQDTLVNIEGVECARLLLVIGDAHEGYKTNLVFAYRLQEKAEELYPGLMKPLRIASDRRYNQQLHPHAILLEVGSDLNTAEDAVNSVRLFARVLAEVLGEEVCQTRER